MPLKGQKSQKRRDATIIGAASETQHLFCGLDDWKPEKETKHFRNLCEKRGVTFDGMTDEEIRISVVNKYRKRGLIGGINDGRNNSMPLTKCMNKLDALLDHFGIETEDW